MKLPTFSVPLLFLLLLNVLPPAFISQLIFDNAPEIYLPEDQPAVILEKELRKIFPDDQVAIILFGGKELYSDTFLSSLEKATLEIKKNAKIDRVINVTEMEHISGTADGFEVTPLLGNILRQKLKKPTERFSYALNDRIAEGLVVSADQDYMAIIVRPHPLESTVERIQLMNRVSEILANNDLMPYVAGMAGPMITEIEQFNSMIWDTTVFVPGTLFIGLFLIWLMYRRWLAVFIAWLVTGAVVNSTVMLFILFGLPYTLIASMIPPLLAALTTAFLVHFYSHMQLASAYSYQGKKRVRFALNEIRKPAFYTAITTAIGLSSLGVSPIPPIRDFGLIAAAGVMFLLLIVMFIVPGLFEQYDHSQWQKPKQSLGLIDDFLNKMVKFSIRHALWVVLISMTLMLAGIPLIMKVTAETNLLKFFPPEHTVTTSTSMVEDKLTGVMPLEISLYGETRDIFKRVDSLKQIRKLQLWLQKQPEIDKVNSLVDLVEEMHKGFHQDDINYQKIPENNQLISQYFFVYDGKEIYELVNREFDQTRLVISMNEHNSRQIREIISRINQYLQDNIKGLEYTIGGEGRVFADQDRLLIHGQVVSLITAVIFIFLIMLVLWKNIFYALITMLPNLSPVIGIFILMGIFNIWLDMATAMIASVSIGIAVDDTIHMFHGYKKRLDRGISVVYALVQSYYKAGRAIVITTIILCAQFFLLSFSDFIPTSHFGMLTAVGLIMALLFDLLLLPAIIVVFSKWKRPATNRIM